MEWLIARLELDPIFYVSHECSKIALDLKASQWELIDNFFNTNNNKFIFSQRYIEKVDEYDVPPGILEIRGWLE